MCSTRGYLAWSIINCMLFTPLVAFPALLFSILTFIKFKDYSKHALVLNIVTSILGTILWILLIVVYFGVYAYISSGLTSNFYKNA